MKEWYIEHKETIKKVSDIAFYISIGIVVLLIILGFLGVGK